MSDLSDYAENACLKWLLTADSVTRPTGWFVALFTTAAGDSGGGTEVSGGGYARQAVTITASGDTGTNANELTFSAVGADWGEIVHAAIMDEVSNGQILLHAAIETAFTVANGYTLSLPAGSLIVRFR